jgi:hypothetical protein
MNVHRTGRRKLCRTLLATSAVAVGSAFAPCAPVNAAKAKPTATTKKAPTTTTKPVAASDSADLLPGTWKWVKSKTSVRFRDGKEEVAKVKPVPGSTLTFKQNKLVAGVAGQVFSGTDFQGNPMVGKWTVQAGEILKLTFSDGTPSGFNVLRKLNVTDEQLIMSADDKLVAAPFQKFATGGPKDVIGGSSYDELIRVQ